MKAVSPVRLVRSRLGDGVWPRATIYAVATRYDDVDEREAEVADMARRAAQAASDRRKRIRQTGTSLTAADVDSGALARMDRVLEDIATWTPGFGGAMLFRGADAFPLVSLITAAEGEAMRRVLINTAVAARKQMDNLGRDSIGNFVDSVTSTARGALIVTLFDDDLLVVGIEGRPARVLDAWQAISNRRADLLEATASLVVNPDATS